jgi:hypothetical protein
MDTGCPTLPCLFLELFWGAVDRVPTGLQQFIVESHAHAGAKLAKGRYGLAFAGFAGFAGEWPG